MSSSERSDALLRLLRRRADWTTDALAAELAVSRRTVLRDLNRLRDRGFIIRAMSGPGGGVRLDPSSVLVSSQLASRDVVALILTIAVARATPAVPFAAGAERALAKIENALPASRAAEIQRFMDRVLIGDATASSSAPAGPVDDRFLLAFEEAFTQQRLLRFRYQTATGTTGIRRIEPHGLLVRVPHWYAIAWDLDREAARLFRSDRVRDPRVAKQAFAPRPYDLVSGVCPDGQPFSPSARRRTR
jgi:predicted DNA-binding transcriptional regulator YafY